MRVACLLLVALFISLPAYAEIEKIATLAGKGIELYWWPKLAPIEGWHQDQDYSFFYRSNAFAPNGFTFKTAESVMYANAQYKPRCPEIKSLQEFIDNDRKSFEANTPGVSIQEVAPLSTADGRKLRSFTFFPTKNGNWERVSYGEEDEFYLIFTISSRSQSGFNAALPAYEKLVASYKK